MDDICLLFYTNNYFMTLKLTLMNKMQKTLGCGFCFNFFSLKICICEPDTTMETIMDLTRLEEKIQLKSRTDIWRLERSEGGGGRGRYRWGGSEKQCEGWTWPAASNRSWKKITFPGGGFVVGGNSPTGKDSWHSCNLTDLKGPGGCAVETAAIHLKDTAAETAAVYSRNSCGSSRNSCGSWSQNSCG